MVVSITTPASLVNAVTAYKHLLLLFSCRIPVLPCYVRKVPDEAQWGPWILELARRAYAELARVTAAEDVEEWELEDARRRLLRVRIIAGESGVSVKPEDFIPVCFTFPHSSGYENSL